MWRNAVHDKSISIHAPRTGSDAIKMQIRMYAFHFNPRSPHGERQISFYVQSHI